MADESKDQKSKAQSEDEKTNTGTASPEATGTADTAVAEAAGITEGEVHALRDEAGLNQSAGHEMDLHAWAASPAGQRFKDEEKDRQKAEKEAQKRYEGQFNKDGLTEAEAKYREAVDKA